MNLNVPLFSVFSSLDQSRSVSNTRSGQCRLAPLIPCIQDSASIYDLTVRIMFNLHKGGCYNIESSWNILMDFKILQSKYLITE